MEIRAVVVGAKVTERSLLAAAPEGSRRLAPERSLRSSSRGLAWLVLPFNPKRAMVDGLARTLATKLFVFEVEVPVGMRGEELTASSYEAPGRKRERDLTDVASEMLETWTDGEGASDEDVAAVELALFLAEHGAQEKAPSPR